MAVAILSCNFLDAYRGSSDTTFLRLIERETYLDGAKDPQYQRLTDCQGRGSYTEGKIDADVLPNVRVGASLRIVIGPVLEPDIAAYVVPQSVVFVEKDAYEKHGDGVEASVALR